MQSLNETFTQDPLGWSVWCGAVSSHALRGIARPSPASLGHCCSATGHSPDHRVWLHSSSASPKPAALSPCHHSSHPSLITLSRELHLSPDSVVGRPRQGVELQLFQLSLQITRAPHSHQMAGLEVTASEQQNPNTDEPHEQAHTFPQRAICSCSTNR